MSTRTKGKIIKATAGEAPSRKSDEVQFFTRVEGELRQWFRSAVDDIPGLTEKDAFRNLLTYLRDANNPDLVRMVLNRGAAASNPSEIGTQISEALAGTAWGEHAFTRPLYSWAYEEFRKVFSVTGTADRSLRRLTHFKVGFCLLEFCFDVRAEALDKLQSQTIDGPSWEKYYKAADHCAYLSLYHYKQVEDIGEEKHPVATYNRACAWSVRAQLAVEKVLGPESHDMSGVAEAHRLEAQHEMERPWKVLAERWRIDIKDSREKQVAEKSADAFWKNGIKLLRSLREYEKDIERKPLYDIVFLYHLAHRDRDLAFLRFDPMARKEFEPWIRSYDGSKLTSYSKICDHLSGALMNQTESVE
jgi:hypothetical protein